MKTQTEPRSPSQSPLLRGTISVETALLIVGLCVTGFMARGWYQEKTGSHWNDDRVAAIATKAVATCQHARLAGIELVRAGDLEGTLERLAVGETAKSGPFTGQQYIVRDLAEPGARERVKSLLNLEGDRLTVASADGGE